LNIEISATSDKAEKSIDKLVSVLDKLQAATGRCTGLAKLKNQMEKLAAASEKIKNISFGSGKISEFVNDVNKLNDIKTPNLTKLQNQIEKLANVSGTVGGISATNNVGAFAKSLEALNTINVPNLTSFANQMTKLRSAADNLNGMPDISDNISQFVSAVKPFETLGKNNVNTFINSLKKLPDVAEQLNTMNFGSFASDLNAVTAAITPLAAAMEKLGNGYAQLPPNIQKVVSSNSQLVTSTKTVTKTETALATVIGKVRLKMLALFYAASKLTNVLSDCLESSNEYVENLNLFTVAMGNAADSAYEYAQTVNEALGIDISEWIVNQGTFKQVTTGFGVVEEKANLMSKNLTQLGYDISSFFNIDTSEAMTKLQSGISGELEPLRRLGYALDAATLQELAYSHGIKQNINNMTQAQKSQLRYLAIMEQSENVMGDMARTIVTPANSMRILSQQFEQFKRAVGNIVSVFAVKLIPYLQVAIRLLTDLGNWLAKKWGFELPEIDYSGTLSTATDEMEDYSSAADDAADSVAETVKQVQRLAGFDELNILQSDTTSDSGSSTADDTSDLSNWSLDLPEYDFLAGLDEQTDDLYKKAKKKIGEIIDKFKTLRKWIDKNKDSVKKFVALLAGAWALTKLKKFIDKAKELSIFNTAKKWLGNFIDGFKTSTATTFFGKLKDGVSNFRSQLTLAQKVLGVLVGSAMAGYGSYNLFYNLTNDTLTWKKALGDSALIVGGLATSWIFGGLPGLGVAALATAFGAVYGAAKAAKDQADKALQSALDSEWQTAGINIKDYAQSIIDASASLVDAESNFNDSCDALNDIKDAAQEASDKVGDLLGKLTPESWDTESMEDLRQAFADLEKDTKDYANSAVDTLQTYVNANADFIKAVGGDIEHVNKILEDSKTNANSQIDEISAKIDSLTSKEDMSNEDIAQLKTLYDQLANITGVDIGPTNSSLQSLNDEISTLSSTDINLENFNTTKTVVGNLADSLTDAQNQLKDAKGNVESLIETLNVDDEEKQYLRDTFTDVFALKEQDLQEIAKGLEPIEDTMSNVIEQSLNDIKSGHLESYGQYLSDWLLGTDLAEEDIEEAQREFLESMGLTSGTDNFVKQALLESGMTLTDYNTLFNGQAATIAIDKMSREINSKVGNISAADWGFDTLKKNIVKENSKIGKSAVSGFSGGITNNLPISNNAANKLGTDATLALRESLDSHSPSKVTQKIGEDFDTGFVNGITSGASVIIFSITALAAQITSSFSGIDLTDTGTNIGLSLSDGFADGIKGVVDTCNDTLGVYESFEIQLMNAYNDAVPAFQQMANGISAVVGTALGQIGYINYTASGRRIAGYASGGYPKKANLFYANEDGMPELVGRIGNQTAVANTDQITAAIAAAVYNAIKSAQGGTEADGDIVVNNVVTIDGQVIEEQQYKQNKRQAMRSNGRR
jgi:predicted  nucleic acid-binding Zn-ribbon protein